MVNKITIPPTTSELIGTVNEIIDDKQDKLTSDNAGTDIEITDSADVEIDETVTGDNTITLESAKDDSLASLTLYGKCEQSNLPSEYTQVEYIESEGHQYIDTGLAGNNNYIIKGKFYDFGGGSMTTVVCGSNARYGTNYIGRISGTGSSYRFLLSNKKCDLPASSGVHEFIVSSEKVIFDGVEYSWVNDNNSIGQKLYLFYGYYSSEHYAKIRLYYCQLKLNDTLLRNFIPARRNSDSALGVYDTVTGNFLTNSGTGTFTAGADFVPTPDNPMDIVCNNGVVKVNTEASGKNAIDTSDTEQGYLTSTVGQQPNIRSSNASVVIKRAIKVSNGKKYKFSYYSNVAGNRESNIVDNNGIVTLKSNLDCDVGLNEYIIEANTDGYLWVTVQLGDFATVKPTAYEIGQIYADGTVETVTITGGGTATAEMLLKVDNYKDEQELLTGNITRNIGIKVFDGTESWNKWGAFGYYCDFAIDMAKTDAGYVLCTVATNWKFTSARRLLCYVSQTDYPEVTDWTTYLASQYANGTPVIIVYPLATATTETVTAQPLTVQNGTNIVSITQASIDTLSLTAEYIKIIQSECLKISFANDSGFITLSALTPYATQSWVENKGYLTEIPAEYVTDSELTAKGYITNAALVGYATESYVTTAVGSETTARQNAYNNLQSQIAKNTSDISDIEALIPSQATTSNQLADKNFVNSSIATNTSYFIGTFNSVAELEAYSGTVTNNDYAFVIGTDSEGNTVYDRYKYTTATTPASWVFEYELNNSSFTSAQWEAINSGITSGDVSLIGTALQPNDNVSELVNDSGYITGITSSDVTTALGYTPYDSSNPSGYTSNVGTVTSVNSVSPVSGNVTLSIPTDTSDLTNGAGYITSSSLIGYQTTSNLVTSLSSSSTDTQYPSAKCVYDLVGDVETLINAL